VHVALYFSIVAPHGSGVVQRKLAGILAADIIGCSKLMEQGESGRFIRLRARRNDLFEPRIAEHNGHIFRRGMGILA